MNRRCAWPNCASATRQWLADRWCSYGGAVPPDMPEEGFLCPHHGIAYDALAVNEQPLTPAKN
jgi:hypothetical protein